MTDATVKAAVLKAAGYPVDSPHAYDQLPRFSKKEWVRLPYQREEEQAHRVGPAMVLPY